jgi:hypothetical protein
MTEPSRFPASKTRCVEWSTARRGKGIALRALSGFAIFSHAPDDLPQGVRRSYKDINLVTARNGDRGIPRFLEAIGYTANRRFNTLNAGRRLLLTALLSGFRR